MSNRSRECKTLYKYRIKSRCISSKKINTSEIKDCSGRDFLYVNVEASNGPDGPPTSGPVKLRNRDTLRFWNPIGNPNIEVAPGSVNVLINSEPNIGKIWFLESIPLENNVLFTSLPTDWSVAFDSFSTGAALLQDGHSLSIPASLAGCVFVEINVSALARYQLTSFSADQLQIYIVILRNGATAQRTALSPQNQLGFEVGYSTLQLNTILKCSPGDNIDIAFQYVETGGPDKLVSIESNFDALVDFEPGATWATFKYVGFEPFSEDCSSIPPP